MATPQGSDPDSSPINPLPPVVVALSLVIFAVEIAFWAGAQGYVGGPEAVGWRLDAIQRYAVFSQLLGAMAERGTWPVEHLLRFVAFPFVHWGFTHMIFALVFILALGNLVARVFSPWAVLAIFFGSALGGAVSYSLLTASSQPLIGAFPSAYGLIGAYTFILWVSLGAEGAPQHRAFTLIAVLMGIQLVFGLLFGSGPDWVADIAGFMTGFALSFVVSPGGWGRVIDKLRQRR